MPPLRIVVVLVAVELSGAAALAAQCTPGGPPNPIAVSRAIVGTVTDTAHRALENVAVVIGNPRRQARTNAQGRFTLPNLDPGTYEVRVRRIGYVSEAQSFVVTDSGRVARFCLIPEPRALPAVVASAKRLGLSGIIGDSNYKALEGAEVRVVGAGMHVLTDSAGAFHLPVPKGTYPVWVSKPGYARRLVSVTIPGDSGREVAVWLGSPPRNANAIAEQVGLMRERILWASPTRSALVSAEQLAGSEASLTAILGARAKAAIKDACEANVVGSSFTRLPLYMIDKAEIQMVEVYLQGSPRNGPTSMSPGGTQGGKSITVGRQSSGPPRGNQCGTIYVWLKH